MVWQLSAGSRRGSPPLSRLIGLAAAGAVLAAVVLSAGRPGAVLAAQPSGPVPTGPSATPSPDKLPPVLAYYYMWFNAGSWTHNKSDVPVLGPYDSTNPEIIAKHVAWAKAAGVDAFIASWKNTPNLDKALAELVAQSQAQGLKLVLIYEGLDVKRNPLPVATVKADLAWFMDQYGSNPVFDLYGKPAIVWSGTWKFSDSDIGAVRAQLGGRALLLGSERDAGSYALRAHLLDGDAYYWSSGDPFTTPGYQKRLDQLAAAVHNVHGLWLAPADAGFDGPQNGGTIVVDRRNGATLTKAWQAALATSPDGIAVISWNEFTEASYIEPSQSYGVRYLEVLALLTGAHLPADMTTATLPPRPAETAPPSTAPSNDPLGVLSRGGPVDTGGPSIVVAAVIFLLLALLGVAMRRRSRNSRLERASRYE